MDPLTRHAVTLGGDPAGQPLVFVHGFGCDQAMWAPVARQFADMRTVLLDLVGFGRSDVGAYDMGQRHAHLGGHAEDVVEVCRALRLESPVLVGHSVGAMIGVLASVQAPELFSRLVLVGPSPCYYDEGEYRGGFSRPDLDELLASMAADFVGWSESMAPVIAGSEPGSVVGDELTGTFCRADPVLAHHFARVTFLSDNRADLGRVSVPTLILQCAEDVIAPDYVGEFVHASIPGSEFVYLAARGHCPNLTAPQETATAIRAFLGS